MVHQIQSEGTIAAAPAKRVAEEAPRGPLAQTSRSLQDKKLQYGGAGVFTRPANEAPSTQLCVGEGSGPVPGSAPATLARYDSVYFTWGSLGAAEWKPN